MGTATTTNSGHARRAIRFFDEPEIFAGIAVTEQWPDENSPPNPEITAVNLGRIYNKSYNEDSGMSSSDCDVFLNHIPFKQGCVSFRLTVNAGGNTFKLEKTVGPVFEDSSKTLIDDEVNAAPDGISTIVEGLTIKTPASMVEGDTFTFTVDGPIGFKKAIKKYLVVPDATTQSGNPNDYIDYRGSRWRIVTRSEALELGARYVYVEVSLNYNELPITDFRQIGIFTGLERASTVVNTKENLLPSEIQTTGALELLDNRTVISRNEYQKETFSFIIEH